MKQYSQEIILSTLAFVWLLFTSTNINQSLGTIYVGFVLGSAVLLIIAQLFFNKKLDITFDNGRVDTINAIFGGVSGWIILMIVQSLVFKLHLFDGSLLGSTALALADSKFANFFTFGVVIAYTETTLWARLYELIADNYNIRINKEGIKKISIWVIIIALSILFTVFHFTSKGIQNTQALFIVFVMMVISLLLVTLYEETREAIIVHVLANCVGAYYMFFQVVR